MTLVQRAVQRWKEGEISWETLVEVVRRIPLTTRSSTTPAETIDEQWERAEEGRHEPGTWDDLYLEWLFHALTDDEFHELERALLTRA